jgi:hypothetical protein
MKKTALFGFVATLSTLGVVNVDLLSLGTAPANAVVYCRTVGVPSGCVARPAGAAVVHPVATRPVVSRPVVYCRAVGVPKGCVMR